MSMNIGPMLRALMGDGQPADGSRALELRIGQIVRGVLMEMLDNHEALMNINGVHVRAKLDAEMAVGKSTLLQVQPGGSGGLVVLKPLADPSDAFPEEGLKDVLKSFGLPEHKWALDLIRGLKRDGYPIGRETAAYFSTAAEMKPARADMQSWAGAVDVAFRRGLTPTETTLASLRQALFAAPMHEVLADLQSALTRWLGGSDASPQASALGQKVQNLLSQGAALLAQAEAQLSGQAGGNTSLGVINTNQAAAAAGQREEAADSQKSGAPGKAPVDVAAARAGGGPIHSAQAQNAPGSPAGSSLPETQKAGISAGPHVQSRPIAEGGAAVSNASGAADAANRIPAQPPAPKPEAAWIGRFLQWLGAGHEHRLLHAAEGRMPGEAGLPAGPGLATAPGADAPAPSQEARPADTLKGALLALAAHEEVPPAVREAAQSLAAHITGQQLLLSSERNQAAPFSHMTLFVPMKGADGDTTATVHVQTRRNRRGEWDAHNCRLLFDLRMRHVGDTVVDVQVVDRIVSLKLLNDYPGMPDLIEQARGELTAGMSSAGFQLLSLTVSPLPQWKDGSASVETASGNADKSPAAGAYAAKPYKGVDFRV